MFVRFVKVIDGFILLFCVDQILHMKDADPTIIFLFVTPYLVFKAALYITLDISFLPWRY